MEQLISDGYHLYQIARENQHQLKSCSVFSTYYLCFCIFVIIYIKNLLQRNLVKKISMVATEIEARQCKDCMIVKNSAMMRYINQVKWIQDCGIFPSTSVYKIFGLCALNYLLGASLVRVIAKGVLGDTKILITVSFMFQLLKSCFNITRAIST